MALDVSVTTGGLIRDGNTFRDSRYLGHPTKAAYWLLLLGTICAALSLLTLVSNHVP